MNTKEAIEAVKSGIANRLAGQPADVDVIEVVPGEIVIFILQYVGPNGERKSLGRPFEPAAATLVLKNQDQYQGWNGYMFSTENVVEHLVRFWDEEPEWAANQYAKFLEEVSGCE